MNDSDYVGDYEAILYDPETDDDTMYLDYSEDEERLDEVDTELKGRGFDITRLDEGTKKLLVTNTVQSWKDIADQPVKDVIYIITSGLLHQRACGIILQSFPSAHLLEGYGKPDIMQDVFTTVILNIRDLESLKSIYLTTVSNMQVLDTHLPELRSSWLKYGVRLTLAPPPFFNTFSHFVKWTESNYLTYGGLKNGNPSCSLTVIECQDIESWRVLVDNGYVINDDNFTSIMRSPKVREFGQYYVQHSRVVGIRMLFIFGSVDQVERHVLRHNTPPKSVYMNFLLRPDFDENYSKYIIGLVIKNTRDCSFKIAPSKLPSVGSVMGLMIDTYRSIYGPRTYPIWLLYFLEGIRQDSFGQVDYRKFDMIRDIENMMYS